VVLQNNNTFIALLSLHIGIHLTAWDLVGKKDNQETHWVNCDIHVHGRNNEDAGV
jgi:hypothetical protein